MTTDPDDVDAAWFAAASEVKRAKEDALLVMMGRKELTPRIVQRAREAWDLETRLMEEYPGRMPLRVELGSLSADVGYVDIGPATLPEATFERGGEVAGYLADVLRKLADNLGPDTRVQHIPLPPRLADEIRQQLADSGIQLPEDAQIMVDATPIDVHNTAITEAGAHEDDKQP